MLKRLLFIALVFLMILFSGCPIPITDGADGVNGQPDANAGNGAVDQNNGGQPPSDLNADQNNGTPPAPPAPPAPLTKEEKIEECLSKEVVEKNSCLRNLALEEEDAEICKVLDLAADDCLKDVAVAKGDLEICKEIESSTTKDNCFYSIASEYDETSSCRGITLDTDLRDICYTELAVSQGNYVLCKSVSGKYRDGSYVRDECYSQLLTSNKFIEICHGFADDSLQQNCYLEVGESNLDMDACNYISSTDDKDECIKYVAEDTNNIDACDLLSTKELKQSCIVTIAETLLEKEVCEKITGQEEMDNCYRLVAEEDLDAELCGEIVKIGIREECYLNIAIDTNNAELCANIRKIVDEWDSCYSTVAENTNDAALCENLYLEENYFFCFVNIAVASESPEVCLTIQKTNITDYSRYPTKDLCYKDVSIGLEMASLCDQIVNADLREACIDGNASFH